MASMSFVKNELEKLGLTVAVDGPYILCEDPGLDFSRSHDGVYGVSRWFVETKSEYEEVCAALFEDSKEEKFAIVAEYEQALVEDGVSKDQAAEMAMAMLEIAIEEEHLANKAGPDEEEWNEQNVAGYDANNPLSDESLEATEAYITGADEALVEEEPEVFNFVEHILAVLGRNAQPAADPPAREFTPEPPVKDHLDRVGQLEVARAFNSPKEIWQASQIDDQDHGGIPAPEDYIRDMKLQEVAMAEQKAVVLVRGQRFVAPDGWRIKERRASGRVLYYGSIYRERKARYAGNGSRFTLVRDL